MKATAHKKAGKTALPWEPEADRALAKVPRFIRPLVRRKVQEQTAAQGGRAVTLADFKEAENKFRALMNGRSEKELRTMMPQPNEKGASLVHLESCRAEAMDCPNTLLDIAPWIKAIREWTVAFDLSEKLRRMVDDDTILFHHKIKFSVSGCPNGCSRPQIFDFGLRGRVSPRFDPDECTSCGACALACPDGALVVEEAPPVLDEAACQGCLKCSLICPADCVSLSRPRMELLVGGKLGRHPHLARPAGEFKEPEELILWVEKTVDEYLRNAAPGQRFADYMIGKG